MAGQSAGDLVAGLLELLSLGGKLDGLTALVHSLHKKVDRLMALADDLKAGIQKLNDETTKIGTVIDGLVAKLQAGNLSDAEKAEVFAALNAVSDRLTALGNDPTNPVPPAPPAMAQAHKTAGRP
jgi:hypothetical protein